MEELVFKGKNDEALTNSLLVAEKFGKDHLHVLRDIRELSCSEEFRLSNFGLSSYRNSQNKEMPMYIITKDGFSFLVMGYTGEQAGKFKEQYIKAFNKMEAEIKTLSLPSYQINNPIDRARRWIEEQEKSEQLIAEKNRQIEDNKPKVLFAEAVSSSDDNILIGTFATILTQNGYTIGQNRLFDWLRKHNYLNTTGERHNLPTQAAMNMGLFIIKESVHQGADGVVIVTRTPKITPKGQQYFINKFLNHANAAR